jgi:cytochrome b561
MGFVPGRFPPAGYTSLAKALHWITAALVLGMLGVGLWMTGLPIGLMKLQVYGWHKWIGLTVLMLTLLRLGWRWHAPPPPLPDTITRWERKAAPLGHAALLVLLLAMPVSGWLMSSAAGVSVAWFGVLPLPDLVPRDPELFKVLVTTHYVLSRLLIVVVALHVAAVIRHDLLRRDGIFRRMWPSIR